MGDFPLTLSFIVFSSMNSRIFRLDLRKKTQSTMPSDEPFLIHMLLLLIMSTSLGMSKGSVPAQRMTLNMTTVSSAKISHKNRPPSLVVNPT